jgi:aryl-alcohol dehydrogenase-like predicted oxidoreductase
MIERGYALYWGTSEWSAAQVTEAFDVAEKYRLRKPIVEQPQYNILEREKVETEFKLLYEKYNYGLTTWSPLASGLLTGKYLNNQRPQGARLSLSNMAWLAESALTADNEKTVASFVNLAQSYVVSPTVLALAWCLKNKNVSSVILGATKKEQLIENLKASDYAQKMPAELLTKINQLVSD